MLILDIQVLSGPDIESHDHYYNPLSNNYASPRSSFGSLMRAQNSSAGFDTCRTNSSKLEETDAEIKDDARRANSLRLFDLQLSLKVYSVLSVKEVIQPQVPLRLPCYDFAPVTTLAFGGLAPCGFRHRLRALAASMA